MENFKNLYEVRKTVRFELKPSRKKTFAGGDIFELQKDFEEVQKFFLDIFVFAIEQEKLYQEEEEEGKLSRYTKIEFKKKREIKYTWLRIYTKNEFYDWNGKNDKEKNYALSKIDFLEKEILRWFNEWQELTVNLKNLTQTKEHEKERKSDIAFVLRNFLKRQNFPFIKDFFNAVIDIQEKQGNESDEKIRKFREELREMKKNLNTCAKEYLSSQSKGVLLHKASFNYYTLNKTPKEYENLKLQKELEIDNILPKKICKRVRWNKEKKQEDILFECNSDWLVEIKLGYDIQKWTLDEAYQKMKTWKADQKSDFNEKIGNFIDQYLKKGFIEDLMNENEKKNAEAILREFSVFKPIENFYFYDFLERTKEIKILSNQKNNILQKYNKNAKYFEKIITYKIKDKEDLTEDEKEYQELEKSIEKKAKERGKFFNAPKEKVQTQHYFELCELYKRIAMKRGKIIAEIKGIENEEVQSQLLTHWALIAEEGEKKSVVFIPRKNGEELENHKKAHEFLQKQEKKEFGDIKSYHFKSLTLRALEKLCFKETENTFTPEIKKETNPKVWFPKYKQEWNDEPQKLINFYKQVLQSKYSQKYLDLVAFGDLKSFLETSFDDLQIFESGLEKTCYIKVPIYFSKEGFETFTNRFDAEVFEITTRSISSESKRKENAHAEIWKDFWSKENEEKNHITRLNPEVSVFYRDEIEKKSNALRGNNKSNINNRFSASRFTLVTTITIRATHKKSNLAFKTEEDIKSHIDKFNEAFQNFSGEWVYGIDRGLKELATLNVVKFSDEKNEFGVIKPKEFAKIPVYKLKDEKAILKDENGKDLKNAKGEARKVIDNISEVLEEKKEPDSNLFEKQGVLSQGISCIDLTQAKLIKGHIILNGDQKTYLKLKEISAKRRIFELFSTSKIDKNSELRVEKTTISINSEDGKRDFYWLTKNQIVNSETKKEIQKEQQEKLDNLKVIFIDYLEGLCVKNKFEDIETIEKINHLRDAITANMVGILFHLQKEFKGIIALENLDTVREQSNKKMIDEHFEQSNEDISRRLEWALYRKFANMGEVPSQIKESIFLRDEFKVYQMGLLKFVEVSGTSSNCPNCDKEVGKTNSHFVCKGENNCGFSSKENRNLLEQNLNNSDEVAAYNIAKRGLKLINQKWNNTSKSQN